MRKEHKTLKKRRRRCQARPFAFWESFLRPASLRSRFRMIRQKAKMP